MPPTISVPYPLSLLGEPRPRRIMLVTDAWEPQVNGVVRTLSRLVDELRDMGCEVEIVSPNDGYRTVPLITYSEIRLALGARQDIEERFERFAPDAVHIATEGPLGWSALQAAHLPAAQFPVHHLLPHPVPGVRERPLRLHPAVGRLRRHARLPRQVRPDHGLLAGAG